MMSRQVVIQFVTVGAGVVLARKLGPTVFGIYAIATFFVQAVALFGNFGLAAALVQRRQKLNDTDLAVAFTIQQIFVGTAVFALWIASPYIASLYGKGPQGLAMLVRALSFTLLLTSWRTMGQLQLERELRFHVIARIEVAETVCFQGLAVGLTLYGLGVWSLIVATLAKGMLGFVLTRAMAPWPVRFALDRKVASQILRFGIPFQINMIVNHMSGWITPLLVGPLIGTHAVGYLTWASANGKKPLLLVESVMRVAFPHFARLQSNRQELEEVMRRYLAWLLLGSMLWFSLIFCAGRSVVGIIYGSKWTPAASALILCALAANLDCILWVVGQSLNAVGNVTGEMRRVLLRTVLNLSLSIPFVHWLGFIGVPIAYLCAYGLALLVYFSRTGLGTGSFTRVLLPQAWCLAPAVAACLAGAALHEFDFPREELWRALLELVVGGVVFGLTAWLAVPVWLRRRFVEMRGRWVRWPQAGASA